MDNFSRKELIIIGDNICREKKHVILEKLYRKAILAYSLPEPTHTDPE